MPPLRLPLALLLLPLLAGCDLLDRPPLSEEFGAPYDLVLGAPATSGGSQPTPFLSAAGEFFVTVAYRGGCHDHHFSLRSATANNVARLWLVHQDFDDACGERVEEALTFTLSPTVLAQPTVELLRPDGGTVPLRTPTDR